MNEWIGLGLGLIALYFGAEALVKGGAGLALRLGLTPLVIGLTVIAYGTSSPEMVVSVQAAQAGNGAISIGNVVGSNICNIALILGLCALISPLRADLQIVRREVPIMIGVAVLAVLILADGRIARWEGAVLLAGLVLYTYVTVRQARAATAASAAASDQAGFPEELGQGKPLGLGLSIVAVVGGLAVLVVGSHFFVQGAVTLASNWGMSEMAIGLTIVAVGTSMPELATSLLAAIKRQGDVAIGNIVGSNIFNVLGILGVAAMVSPLEAPTLSWVDLGAMVAVSVALLPVVRSGGRISRGEGAVMLAVYVAYTWWLLRQSGA
ncbi:MAG: calcium/sodium antiporter [Opitutaceae bacterium]|jgi:cation:H+ antiporter|nr:calcium/sodium antiporter [Opitutaceae bacterium]